MRRSNGVADWLSRIPLATKPWRDYRIPESTAPKRNTPAPTDEATDVSDFEELDALGRLAFGSLDTGTKPVGLEPI